MPKALISDQGSHFYNKAMSFLLHKFGVVHRVAIAYHPQTNGQVEVFNSKSRKHCKRWPIPTGWTRVDSLRTPCGHTELHIGLRWECLPTRLFPNIELIGLSSNATYTMTKLDNKESSNYKNWMNFAWKPMKSLGFISKLHSKSDRPLVLSSMAQNAHGLAS
ncbi:hypothetical protein CR513_16068, partial [Mucuna pruriens]